MPAEHFTFSTMVLPAGCEGPLHLHDDVEEVFFILKGNKVKLMCESEGEYYETHMKERDLVSVPAGIYRGLVNEGIEEALMIVCLGTMCPRRRPIRRRIRSRRSSAPSPARNDRVTQARYVEPPLRQARVAGRAQAWRELGWGWSLRCSSSRAASPASTIS